MAPSLICTAAQLEKNDLGNSDFIHSPSVIGNGHRGKTIWSRRQKCYKRAVVAGIYAKLDLISEGTPLRQGGDIKPHGLYL